MLIIKQLQTRDVKSHKQFCFFILACTIIIIWFIFTRISCNLYFAGDDLLFIERTMDWDLSKALNPLNKDRLFFRPLTQDLYFRIMFSLFGMRAWIYHLINMLIYLLNIFLIILISKIITQRIRTALYTAFFYMMAPFNFRLYTWISCIQDILMITFALLSILCFLKSQNYTDSFPKNKMLKIIAPLFFLLSLFSKESAIWLPFWLWIYELLNLKNSKKRLKKQILQHLSFDVIMLFYLIFRIKLNFPKEGKYILKLGINILKNFEKYVYDLTLALGNPFTKIDNTYYICSILFLIIVFLSLIKFIYKPKILKLLVLGFGWYFLGVSVFLPLLYQRYDYYISFASIGILLIVGHGFSTLYLKNNRIYKKLTIFCLLWILSISGYNYVKIYPEHIIIKITQRTKMVHKTIKILHKKFPSNAKVIIFDFYDNPSLLGIRALYNQYDLKVFTAEQVFKTEKTPNGIAFIPRDDFNYQNSYFFIYKKKQGLEEINIDTNTEQILKQEIEKMRFRSSVH